MPRRADISNNKMRYHFTNYWKTEQEIILNEPDREVFKNAKLDPIWKIMKKKQIYLIAHCNQRWFEVKVELLLQSTSFLIFH